MFRFLWLTLPIVCSRITCLAGRLLLRDNAAILPDKIVTGMTGPVHAQIIGDVQPVVLEGRIRGIARHTHPVLDVVCGPEFVPGKGSAAPNALFVLILLLGNFFFFKSYLFTEGGGGMAKSPKKAYLEVGGIVLEGLVVVLVKQVRLLKGKNLVVEGHGVNARGG